MMSKKLTGMAGTILLAVIVAGCSGVARGEASPAEVEELQAGRPISDTARVHIDPEREAEVAAVTGEENIPAGDEVTNDLVEPVESQGVATNQVSPSLSLPKPENDVADIEFRWSQLLSRDAIFPIYEPEFSAATDAPYADDELVIGVEINGEAKAYAIGPLNGREMVNDTVGGTPVLVTW